MSKRTNYNYKEGEILLCCRVKKEDYEKLKYLHKKTGSILSLRHFYGKVIMEGYEKVSEEILQDRKI